MVAAGKAEPGACLQLSNTVAVSSLMHENDFGDMGLALLLSPGSCMEG